MSSANGRFTACTSCQFVAGTETHNCRSTHFRVSSCLWTPKYCVRRSKLQYGVAYNPILHCMLLNVTLLCEDSTTERLEIETTTVFCDRAIPFDKPGQSNMRFTTNSPVWSARLLCDQGGHYDHSDSSHPLTNHPNDCRQAGGTKSHWPGKTTPRKSWVNLL